MTGRRTALRCPVCDQLVTDSYGDLYAVDVSTRWNIAKTDDTHRQMSVSRGDDDYGSTLYYLHTTGQPHAVVPPEDVTESWS